jgi:hypothetical protein
MKFIIVTLFLFSLSVAGASRFPKDIPTAHMLSYQFFQVFKKYMAEVKKKSALKFNGSCVDIYTEKRIPLKACVNRRRFPNKIIENVKYISPNLDHSTLTYVRYGSNLVETPNQELQFMDFLKFENDSDYSIKMSMTGLDFNIRYDTPESISEIAGDSGRYRHIVREYSSPYLSWKKYQLYCKECSNIDHRVRAENIGSNEFDISYFVGGPSKLSSLVFWQSFGQEITSSINHYAALVKRLLIGRHSWPEIQSR